MKIPPKIASPSITAAMVRASSTWELGIVFLKTVTVSLPRKRFHRNRSITRMVTVFMPPAVEPEEPPMSISTMETALPASVSAP